MTTTDPWIHDLPRVHSGDRIEVWDERRLRPAGTVIRLAAHLGVPWILENATGVPQLIPAQDYRLRHAQHA